VLRLDTLKLGKGWDCIDIPNPSLENGVGYGVFPLGLNNEKFEFLVFGGFSTNNANMERTCIFSTSLSNFSKSEFILLEEEIEEGDQFIDNRFIPLPQSLNRKIFKECEHKPNLRHAHPELLMIEGQENTHIFDKTSRRWI